MEIAVNLDAFCINQNQREHTKVTINSDQVSSVYHLKAKIQDLLNVPICEQSLSFLGRPLNDPQAILADLYIREGDTISVEFLEKVNIKQLDDYIKTIKDFYRSLSPLCDGCHVRVPSVKDVERVEDLYADLTEPLESLSGEFDNWKTAVVRAIRHYFVQEGGLDALMDLMDFSLKRYAWFTCNTALDWPVLDDADDTNDDENGEDLSIRSDELVQNFNEWQITLCFTILQTLWTFMETGPDTRLVLDMGGLQTMIDAYLKYDNCPELATHLVESLRENALGCMCGCLEYDAMSQRHAAGNLLLMAKLSNMVETTLHVPTTTFRREILYECSYVANALFYISFDQKALEVLIERGFYKNILVKMQIFISQGLMTNSILLQISYYCLLFLARVGSSTLCTVPPPQRTAIDACIEQFMTEYSPSQFAEYEDENHYVWMTLLPIVHMAFAAGPRELNELGETMDGCGGREDAANVRPWDQHDETNVNVSSHPGLDWYDIGNPYSARWPGSPAIQKLAIFSLQHTLFSEDNRKLLISKNLHLYLICLLWQSRGKIHEQLKRELMVVRLNVPSLRVICKSVLARMNGLDSVLCL